MHAVSQMDGILSSFLNKWSQIFLYGIVFQCIQFDPLIERGEGLLECVQGGRSGLDSHHELLEFDPQVLCKLPLAGSFAYLRQDPFGPMRDFQSFPG